MNPEVVYVRESSKSFEQASEDLDRAVNENGRTRIGMIKPQGILAGLSSDPALASIANEVEAKTIAIIDAAF